MEVVTEFEQVSEFLIELPKVKVILESVEGDLAIESGFKASFFF